VAVQLGYTNIFRDPHGIPAWQAAGMPVSSNQGHPAGSVAEQAAPGQLQGWAMLWTLMGIFMGGMALNLTPCVYPLIPITVSYFGGRSGLTRGGLMGHGILYMFGLALTNSILGVIAALTGGLMGAVLQHPAVLIAIAALLILFATSLFGLWEIRLPYFLTHVASHSYSGYFGTFFMGLTLGIVAAPCLGPFILGLLTWVAGMGSPWIGFIVFFTLSLGLGLPLFMLAVFSGKIEALPRSGEWMLWVRKLLGWVLVGMAAYFVRPILPDSWGAYLLATVAIAAGITLGWVDRTNAGFKAFGWVKTGFGAGAVILAAFLVGAWLIRGPGVVWQPYTEEVLVQAKAMGKPVIIDFSANWCAPCRELDENTFHDPVVVKKSKSELVMVKVDLTQSGNAFSDRLIRDYGVKGVPTVVFIDGGGKERRDLRLVDYLPADQFLQRVEDVLAIRP
jgi:thioredoxin:protein disulfide reductase